MHHSAKRHFPAQSFRILGSDLQYSYHNHFWGKNTRRNMGFWNGQYR